MPMDQYMSASGQSRRFGRRPAPSGPPRSTDIVRPPRHVGLVPIPTVAPSRVTKKLPKGGSLNQLLSAEALTVIDGPSYRGHVREEAEGVEGTYTSRASFLSV
jgi:hypothetical protein